METEVNFILIKEFCIPEGDKYLNWDKFSLLNTIIANNIPFSKCDCAQKIDTNYKIIGN